MGAGLAIVPTIMSNGVFFTRRTNSGLDAMAANNPFVGAMNLDIAGGQVVKAFGGAADVAKGSHSIIADSIVSAEELIKNASKTSKLVSGVGKVLDFTADHINPIIGVTGVVKVACADDKEKEAIREGLAIPTMLGFEAITKKVIGMPEIKKIEGKRVAIPKDGLYKKNLFLNQQASAIKDFCETTKVFNKSIKWAPGAIKGLAFVGASITGYKTGLAIADKIANAVCNTDNQNQDKGKLSA